VTGAALTRLLRRLGCLRLGRRRPGRRARGRAGGAVAGAQRGAGQRRVRLWRRGWPTAICEAMRPAIVGAHRRTPTAASIRTHTATGG